MEGHAPLSTRTAIAKLYEKSVDEPDKFWGKQGKRIDWIKPYTKVKNTSFAYPDVSIKWFEDGTLNVAANCIDRHLKKRGKQTAIICEPDDPKAEAQHITYRELHENVCRLANVLKAQRRQARRPCHHLFADDPRSGLRDARLRAHRRDPFGGVRRVLAGFARRARRGLQVEAGHHCRRGLARRTQDPAQGQYRRGAEANSAASIRCWWSGAQGLKCRGPEGRDLWLHDELAKVDADCPAEEMNAEDPLFILYTSGSTGLPKGVLHTSGGYLVFASMTHQYVFDYHDGDIYWCTADVGWVTGHSYIVYGPLANGATTVIFEGVPNYPDPSRFWQVVDKHKVNIFYTAPTAIRALMGAGEEHVKKSKRKSLRLLGSVGEPINPEAWEWYYHVVGEEPLPDRGYLVANRNRRHPHHAAAGRDQAPARLRDAALLRRAAGGGRFRGQYPRRRDDGQSRHP